MMEQWNELSRRCSDLGFSFVSIPAEADCLNSYPMDRIDSGTHGNLSFNRLSKTSVAPSFPRSPWKSQFERVARQVLNFPERPQTELQRGSDSHSSSYFRELLSPPALPDVDLHYGQSRIDPYEDDFTDRALDCRDNHEGRASPLSSPPVETILPSSQELQHDLTGFYQNSNLNGVGAASADSATDHVQIVSPETTEVNLINPLEVALSPPQDSQCGSPAGLTDRSREVDQMMFEYNVASPWSSTSAYMGREGAKTNGGLGGIYTVLSHQDKRYNFEDQKPIEERVKIFGKL